MGYDKNSLITISGQQNYRVEAHMINFSHLQLKQSTLNELKKLQINFAFQPIYDLINDRASGAEALVRLIDPVLGFISPDEFIPIAEKKV